jgi:hypothetical protein
MAPVFVFNNTVKADLMGSIETVLVHLVTPLLFITFAIFTMKYQGADKTKALPLART